MHENSFYNAGGFARPWLALTIAFALHVFDEAVTGFLNVYNPTVTILRQRWPWFPMPTFEFREWLIGLIVGVLVCFALTPFAARNARWLRPLAWVAAVIQFLHAMGHTIGTILGHTVPGHVSAPCAGILFISTPLHRIDLARGAAVADCRETPPRGSHRSLSNWSTKFGPSALLPLLGLVRRVAATLRGSGHNCLDRFARGRHLFLKSALQLFS
jgi:hypothetical protein